MRCWSSLRERYGRAPLDDWLRSRRRDSGIDGNSLRRRWAGSCRRYNGLLSREWRDGERHWTDDLGLFGILGI
jgi:hypothetical protein